MSSFAPLKARTLAFVVGLACLLAAPSAAQASSFSCFGESGYYVRAGHSIALEVHCEDFSNPDATWTMTVGTPPDASKGSVSGPTSSPDPGGKTFTYTATPAFTSGFDSFTVHAQEDGVAANHADVNINVSGEEASANHVPSCFEFTDADDREEVQGASHLFAGCSDQEKDPITLVVDTQGTLGNASPETFQGQKGFLYTPNDNSASGTDQFTWHGTDGIGNSDVQTRYLQVTGVQPPTCTIGQVNVRTNAEKTVFPDCTTNNDDDEIQLVIDQQPAHGTVSLDEFGEGFRYVPDHDYQGADSFKFHAVGSSSGAGPVVTANVHVGDDVNTAPECDNDNVSVRAGDEIDLTIFCFDDDGDKRAYSLKTAPSAGTLVGDVTTDGRYGHVGYAAPSSPGTATVVFTANDGHGGTADATLTIHISAADANNPPNCGSTTIPFEVVLGTSRSFNSPCFDPDGDPLVAAADTAPSHGSVTFNGAGGTYTPGGDAANGGTDQFKFTESDGRGGSALITVNVTFVSPDKPTCNNPDTIALRPGTGQWLPDAFEAADLLCSASHWGSPSIRIAGNSPAPTHGTVTVQDGQILYKANPNAADGDDQVILIVSNNGVDSDPITQTIQVRSNVETNPTCFLEGAFEDQFLIPQPGSRKTPFSCSDREGDEINLTPTVTHGSATVNVVHSSVDPDTGVHHVSGTLTITPDNGYTGPTTITLGGTDGTLPVVDEDGGDGPPSFDGQVVPAAEVSGPSCYPQNSVRVRAGQPVTFTVFCDSILDGDITATHGDPSHGSATGFTPVPDESGEFTATFTAPSDYAGWVSIPVTGHQGGKDGGTAIQLVRVLSNSVNHKPTCFSDNYEVQAGHGVTIDNCSDPDGDPLTLTLTSGPSHGTLVGPGPDGRYVYQAASGPAADDAMTFTASDGHGGTSNPVTVTIHITEDKPETSTEQAEAGTPVSNAFPGATPSPGLPVIVEVTSPTAGQVTLTEQAPTTSAPSGFKIVGREFQIEAPTASVDAPLMLAFSIDQSFLPSGVDYTNVELLRNGTAIGPCTDPNVSATPLTATSDTTFTKATPDPCIARRQSVGTGDARLVVLSSHASTWNFAAPNQPSNNGGGSTTPTPTSGGGTTGKPSGGGTPAPKDTKAPAVTVKIKAAKLKFVLAHGLTVTPACDEACAVTVKLVLSGKLAKKLHLSKKAKPFVVGSASGTGGKKMVVKLSAKAKKAFKKLKKLSLSVVLQAMDASRNTSRPVTKTVNLKR